MATVSRELETARLRLRRWVESDRPPFAELNADPRVMEFISDPLSRADSDLLAEAIAAQHAARQFGLWAVELPGVAPFIGFVGLSVPSFEAPFTPCVEIGWRLAAACWGRGLATEAARAVLAFGFEELALHEIVAFTARDNVRSRRVMQKLGMTRDAADDFDHPRLSAGDPLRSHVLYRLSGGVFFGPELNAGDAT